jgi:hypothetical protein
MFSCIRLGLVVAAALAMSGCDLDSSGFSGEYAGTQTQTAPPASGTTTAVQLVIDTNSLPATYPRATYVVHLQQHGGAAPPHWKVEKGDLPPGLTLDDDGTLHGTPAKVGEYRFTISVTDSGKPAQAVQREYVLNVLPAMAMTWKAPPHVTGNRIDGSVQVSNYTEDEIDFTFVVLAVNENGRATAIGYQRFPLKKGTTDFVIPFGDTLPHGAYIVHADGVGEIAEKNQIHRARLQTPGPLQVVVGP